ncbi:putative alpha-galactosidase a protein [Diplogelasinospora grovesii]|uniref:Alpha-galactosidase a protein n=1 Tax=Diplogelasinospora grovesii TaxID=303347 RepID=A0AAN6MX09_9PEZI|nr:putative alpha-galactosidase a protein [Diplogelasinospora grovesii]
MDYVSASIIPAPQGVTDAQEVVRVSEWLPGHWVGIENETCTYEIIQSRDPGLAPRFLAHVTENGSRVIGFLLERIPDAREAGPADLEKCKAALARLHALGIAKRKLSRHSFLVRNDGSVLIQGPFTGSPEDVVDNDEVMKTEMESLEKVLARSPSVFEDQSARMLRLVDPQRMKMLEEFEKAHGFVVPFVHWQESREGGGRITLTLEQHGVLAKEYEENGFRWTKEL